MKLNATALDFWNAADFCAAVIGANKLGYVHFLVAFPFFHVEARRREEEEDVVSNRHTMHSSAARE